MEERVGTKSGHTIVTWRVRLYDRHFKWLEETKALYVRVAAHFLSVLRKEPELLKQSDFLLLRALETMCIGTKEMKAAGVTPKYPMLDFPKVPLYFRRSAINASIDLARKNFPETEELKNCPMVLYKGMYQEFSDTSIELKLFHDGKWSWVRYPFTGRTFPEGGERLSPSLVLEKKDAYLNVPVSVEVSDVRTVKERMKTEERICAVYFPDQDVMAAAVILDKTGKQQECRFFRGGKQKEHQKSLLFQQIAKSRQSRGTERRTAETPEAKERFFNVGEAKENNHLYQQLKEINKYYAHCISRQILTYCAEQNIKVIVVPNYENALDFSGKHYLNTDTYRWIGRSIIQKLKYKAFSEGIVVTSVRPVHIVDRCSNCGGEIRRYNEGHSAGKKYFGGKLFVCSCGNKGNVAENAAKNVGKSFLSYYV